MSIPSCSETYKKLGIPLVGAEAACGCRCGCRCSIPFRSPPPFKAKLTEAGVIFCPISEAIRDFPDLVKKYLGTVVPVTTISSRR
jgi:Fe-S cluster assembly protein SufB